MNTDDYPYKCGRCRTVAVPECPARLRIIAIWAVSAIAVFWLVAILLLANGYLERRLGWLVLAWMWPPSSVAWLKLPQFARPDQRWWEHAFWMAFAVGTLVAWKLLEP